jgi:hypothetical protein
VVYLFEERFALKRVIIEVVFLGGLKKGVMGRNKRGADSSKARLSLRVRGGFRIGKRYRSQEVKKLSGHVEPIDTSPKRVEKNQYFRHILKALKVISGEQDE